MALEPDNIIVHAVYMQGNIAACCTLLINESTWAQTIQRLVRSVTYKHAAYIRK